VSISILNFLSLNPAGKVPVLVDGDMVIPESAAIVLYLADKYREKKLLPASVGERAQVYRWIMFAVTELEQPLWRISKHTALYPEDKRLPANIVLAREEFLAMAAILDSHLEGRRFIVGDSFTVADCVTAYLVDWANEFHLIDDVAQLRASRWARKCLTLLRLVRPGLPLKSGRRRMYEPQPGAHAPEFAF
jgi:glutathione S-transferase